MDLTAMFWLTLTIQGLAIAVFVGIHVQTNRDHGRRINVLEKEMVGRDVFRETIARLDDVDARLAHDLDMLSARVAKR